MKTYISAWPVNRQEQEKLGIYNSGYVRTQAVGGILHRLVKLWYMEINSFVEAYGQDDAKKNELRVVFHCSKPKGEFYK